jgi:hypothetical protein
MNLKTVLTLLFALFSVLLVNAQPKFDKSTFYKAMASEDLEQINTQLGILQKSSIAEKEAYEGALQMQKAGMVGGPSEKLSLFNNGRKKLESAITRDGKNLEFSFLRLMIQENAPRILGYYHDIEKDSEVVRKNFKKFPQMLQYAIADYSKKSKVLNPKDFQG